MTNTNTFAFNTTDTDFDVFPLLAKLKIVKNIKYENHFIAIVMSSSLDDPMLGLNILQG